jgi:hypothetical protein
MFPLLPVKHGHSGRMAGEICRRRAPRPRIDLGRHGNDGTAVLPPRTVDGEPQLSLPSLNCPYGSTDVLRDFFPRIEDWLVLHSEGLSFPWSRSVLQNSYRGGSWGTGREGTRSALLECPHPPTTGGRCGHRHNKSYRCNACILRLVLPRGGKTSHVLKGCILRSSSFIPSLRDRDISTGVPETVLLTLSV